MRNVLSIVLMAVILFSLGSCTKEAANQSGQNPFYVPSNTGNGNQGTDPDPDPAPTNPVGDVPSNFTKKVLIEKMTGEWCGACPNGGNDIEAIINANAGKVYSASWQMSNGDPFEIPEAKIWRSHLAAGAGVSSYGFPSASVSRRLSITLPDYTNTALDKSGANWTTQTNDELAIPAECGLALVSNEQDDKVDVDIYIGYNAPITTANTHLTVYLIEDDVPESTPGAQAGASSGYKHKHMIRDVLTADLGDPVNLTSVTTDKYQKISIKGFDIAGKYHDKSNLKVLAFINIKEATGDKLGVLNVQEVKLGETKKWD